MNLTLDPVPFELAGRFGGFVFTDEGKRRMLLQVGEQACLLKVPRPLRHRIIGKFRPGEPIRVAGTGERDPITGSLKRIVAVVLPTTAAAVVPPGDTMPPPRIPAPAEASGPIRVCTKKHCWRSGGRELWDALGREVAARGLTGQVELRQVGCLGRCKLAPNVDSGRREHTRCSPAAIAAIVGRATGDLSPRQVNPPLPSPGPVSPCSPTQNTTL